MNTPNPNTPPRGDGLTICATESGHVAHVQAGRLAFAIEGFDDEDEAAATMTATLDALAKRRGKQPARLADRTARRLIAALGAP